MGINYKGLSLSECMDKFIDSVEKIGLCYDLDVSFNPFGSGCVYYFAPNVMFYLSGKEYEVFSANIRKAIKKFK